MLFPHQHFVYIGSSGITSFDEDDSEEELDYKGELLKCSAAVAEARQAVEVPHGATTMTAVVDSLGDCGRGLYTTVFTGAAAEGGLAHR